IAGPHQVQAEKAEPRIRAGLADHRADAAGHVDAARAHRHLAGGDGDPQHARTSAAADQRERRELDAALHGSPAFQISISMKARRSMRPVSRESRFATRICQPYFARSARLACAIDVPSVTRRAVASRHSPRVSPRALDGATHARDERRSRLTLPESPAVNT